MIKGTTVTGFSYEYDEANLDDMRVVDLLAEVMDDNAPAFNKITAISKLLTMILGADLKAALYDHIGATHGGRVPRAELEQALSEIMGGSGKDAEKNS